MHRQAWWATVHEVVEGLDTTERVNNKNKQQVFPVGKWECGPGQRRSGGLCALKPAATVCGRRLTLCQNGAKDLS